MQIYLECFFLKNPFQSRGCRTCLLATGEQPMPETVLNQTPSPQLWLFQITTAVLPLLWAACLNSTPTVTDCQVGSNVSSHPYIPLRQHQWGWLYNFSTFPYFLFPSCNVSQLPLCVPKVLSPQYRLCKYLLVSNMFQRWQFLFPAAQIWTLCSHVNRWGAGIHVAPSLPTAWLCSICRVD